MYLLFYDAKQYDASQRKTQINENYRRYVVMVMVCHDQLPGEVCKLNKGLWMVKRLYPLGHTDAQQTSLAS